MISQQITIINKLGLHARAAAKLVKTASAFGSQVTLDKAGQQVNGKSIMGVMMLAASQGSEVTLQVDGEDERQAMQALVDLINDRFGEGE
jgi:phosphocarrier protein